MRRRQSRLLGALACAALVLSFAGAASGRDGDSFGIVLGERLHEGLPHDVILVGDVALVGLDTGVAAYDVSNAASPVRLSHLYLPSPAMGLALSGSNLLVANGESGLAVVDAADADDLRLLGSLPMDDARAVAVSGTLALVADAGTATAGWRGLHTVDISLPAAPQALGFAALANGALAVATDGGHAYVGIGSDLATPGLGLAIVSLADPRAPTQVGFHPVGQPVNSVKLRGSVVNLAAGLALLGSVVTVDVSTPSAPVRLGRLALPDAALDISLSGTLASVAARSLGTLSVDLSNPASPRQQGALPTGRESWSVEARGDVAFVGERSSSGPGGLAVISTPAFPARLSLLTQVPQSQAMGAAIDEGLALLLHRDALHAYWAGSPWSELSAWAPPGSDFSSVVVADQLAAVAEGDCVHLVDLSDPNAISAVGQVCLAQGEALGLELSAGTLFVATGRGVELFDVLTPGSPGALGTWDSIAWSSDVAVDAGLAVVAVGTGLVLLDVESPAAPAQLGAVDLLDTLSAVDIEGGVAVAVGLDSVLHVIDVTDPWMPAVAESLSGGPAFGVSLDAGFALVAAAADGLRVFDVSVLGAAMELAAHDTSGSAWSVATDGSLILLATQDAQHWALGCPGCVAACGATAAIVGASQTCVGQALTLYGSSSSATACPGGVLDYQWTVGGVAIPGATDPTYEVPDTQPAGLHDFGLDVACAAEPTCADSVQHAVDVLPGTWPVVDPLSLRVAKRDVTSDNLTWTAQGLGLFNVHRSTVAADLARWNIDATTVVDVAAARLHVNVEAPAPVLFFRVHGRNSCSGASVP